ncbi:MAG TPA: MFS transporter [Pyrinomonadaceae bacterium]|nr:MFS transporter [Pyrinomonadaceae bacterium]
MSDVNGSRHSGLIAVMLAGVVFLLLAFIAARHFEGGLLASMLSSVGVSCLTAILVFVCGRLYPPPEQRLKVIRGHDELYSAYREALKSLEDGESHEVWTIASLPPSEDTAAKWDEFLCPFLKRNRDVYYHRFVVVDKANGDWARRLDELDKNYSQLRGRNYEEHRTEGPPSIECLMIDRKRGFMTFASGWESQESAGIFVTNEKVCRELQHYFTILERYCESKRGT